MMMEKEDVGLSLSLGFAQNHRPLQLNLKPTSSLSNLHKFPWNQTFLSSPDPQFLGGIDVNSVPSTGDCEEEAGVSSPNSTISSTISGSKRSEREGNDHRNGSSDEEDGGETSRKKLRLSKDQSAVLEETFKAHNTLNPKQKVGLAKQLGLTPRQVEVWFQNRRARTKLKQTEVDCEYLKRCVEKLREDNRRLEKQVSELRALKVSPHPHPTTLIICPSCHRLPASSSSNHMSQHPHRPFTPSSLPFLFSK